MIYLESICHPPSRDLETSLYLRLQSGDQHLVPFVLLISMIKESSTTSSGTHRSGLSYLQTYLVLSRTSCSLHSKVLYYRVAPQRGAHDSHEYSQYPSRPRHVGSQHQEWNSLCHRRPRLAVTGAAVSATAEPAARALALSVRPQALDFWTFIEWPILVLDDRLGGTSSNLCPSL